MAQTVVSGGNAKGLKQTNFQGIEIEQIARSWIVIGSNATVGAGQKSEVFWSKIQAHFTEAMAKYNKKYPGVVKLVPRSIRSLGSKWGEINHDCAKFSGAFSHIVELNESGTNEEEQLEKAMALYQQLHKKGAEFTLMGAWTILKDNPKWQIASRLLEKQLDQAARKRKGGSGSKGLSNAVDGDMDGNVNSSGMPEMNTECPIGNKKAKELARIERKASTNKGALADSTECPIGNKKAKELARIERKASTNKGALADPTDRIADAMNRWAKALENATEIQLFSLNLHSLDEDAKKWLIMKRKVAEAKLTKKFASIQEGTFSQPVEFENKENIIPNIQQESRNGRSSWNLSSDDLDITGNFNFADRLATCPSENDPAINKSSYLEENCEPSLNEKFEDEVEANLDGTVQYRFI